MATCPRIEKKEADLSGPSVIQNSGEVEARMYKMERGDRGLPKHFGHTASSPLCLYWSVLLPSYRRYTF